MHARGLMQAITTVIIRNLLLNNSKRKKNKKIRGQIFSNQMYDKLRKLTEKNLHLDEYLSLVLFSSSHLGFSFQYGVCCNSKKRRKDQVIRSEYPWETF